MDPASAAIAFVGFAASIASLSAVVANSCKTIHNVWHSLKDAPQDVCRLVRKMKRLEKVILEMERAVVQFGEDPSLLDSQQYWVDQIEEMVDDFAILDDKINNLQAGLAAKTSAKKHLWARARKFLSEDDILKYERILSDHLQTFNVMYGLQASARMNSVLKVMGAQTQHVSDLVYSTTNALKTSQQQAVEHFQESLRDDGADWSRRIQQEFRITKPDECTKEHQLALNCLQSIPISENGLHIETQPSTETDLGFQAPPIPFESRRWPLARQAVAGTLYIHHFPVGFLHVRETRKRTTYNNSNSASNGWSYAIEFSLFPPSWIASSVIQISIAIDAAQHRAPLLDWAVKQGSYNNNPSLITCMASSDIVGLQSLFAEGEARPTDLVAPWGNSLLHLAVYSHVSGISGSLEVCRFLLEQGVNPNAVNASGNTPLLLCCILMAETPELVNRLQAIASLLISAGTDLAVCDRAGNSACSLIFRSRHGLAYLESFVYKYIDPSALQEMASANTWVLAALARSFPTFQRCLENQLAEYRTPMTLSSCRRPIDLTVTEFDLENQIAGVKLASVAVRTKFLGALCTGGTLSMIAPFLNCGVNLDELEPQSFSTYIRTAARHGQLETMLALMEAGASVNVQPSDSQAKLREWDPIVRDLGPVEDLLERWFSLREGRPTYTGKPENEYWILTKLLQSPTFNGSNVLFKAIWTGQPPAIFKCLLDAGCGRRDNTAPESWCQKVKGSEVIEAVKSNNPNINLLLNYGLGMECEDCLKFTALLHALDRGEGCVDFTKMLIDAGADLVRRTGSGFTPLEFAAKNMKAKHPRLPNPAWTLRAWELRPVSLEEDQHAYDLLKMAIREKNLPQEKGSFRDLFSDKAFRALQHLKLYGPRSEYFRSIHSISEFILVFCGYFLTFSVLLLGILWQLTWKAIQLTEPRFLVLALVVLVVLLWR